MNSKPSRYETNKTIFLKTREKILFEDTKEGMMAIRVNRALEVPSDKPVVLSDALGNKTEVAKLDNRGYREIPEQ